MKRQDIKVWQFVPNGVSLPSNITDLLNSAISAEPQRHEPRLNVVEGEHRIERPVRRPRRINAEQREQERLRRNYYNRNQHFRLR